VSTFDAQAQGYDARVGLPSAVGEAVAQAIVSWVSVSADDLVVELGAGTGEIGSHLTQLPLRYVGLDNSAAMLEIFRAKAADAAPALIVADCDAAWPLPDHSAAVVFASRVIHLLQPDHVVRETLRVCLPGGYLMLGRVQREPGSLKTRLQRQRRQFLQEAGISSRHGEKGNHEVIERCLTAGCASHGRRVAAEWTGETSASAIITGWETLSRMGSVEIDADTRAVILAELRDWASVEIGDLDRLHPFREQFVLDIVRVPALDVSYHR
jgi:ubiquinone/menaquinone biosynthesis C-methylase UbiE